MQNAMSVDIYYGTTQINLDWRTKVYVEIII